jgi:hypothetical protein
MGEIGARDGEHPPWQPWVGNQIQVIVAVGGQGDGKGRPDTRRREFGAGLGADEAQIPSQP